MNALRRICQVEPRGLRCSVDGFRRFISVKTERLEFENYGVPAEVISHKTEEVNFDLKKGEVLVKFLASPVNPADINTIQGTYPIKSDLPSVGGGEGVAEVLDSRGTLFSPGDWVLPSIPMIGTWQTHKVLEEHLLVKVRNDISVEGAATMIVNPASALRMLEDYVPLKGEDWVVQNGANSAVGLAVIQIAKKRNLRTINVVRNRDDIADLRAEMTRLGADVVLTEEEARTAWKELPRPLLALNCVGGASGTELCKALARNGTHVTYGGMSMRPVNAATSHLIFKNLTLRGFWLSEWNEIEGLSQKRLDMYSYLCSMIKSGELIVPPLNPVPLAEYKPALEATLAGLKMGKFIFKMY